MWCVPTVDREFVTRMEDVLEVYGKEPTSEEPVICVDEKPVQLHSDARAPVPMKPGRVRRRDYEYVRKGMANVFAVVEP